MNCPENVNSFTRVHNVIMCRPKDAVGVTSSVDHAQNVLDKSKLDLHYLHSFMCPNFILFTVNLTSQDERFTCLLKGCVFKIMKILKLQV